MEFADVTKIKGTAYIIKKHRGVYDKKPYKWELIFKNSIYIIRDMLCYKDVVCYALRYSQNRRSSGGILSRRTISMKLSLVRIENDTYTEVTILRRKDRELTDINEITQILDTCKTACISMVDNGVPYVVPMSYGYELVDNQLILYFHCAKEGRKIDVLHSNDLVCFTIFNEGEPIYAEIPCNSGYYFSSIIGNGNAFFIEDADEKKKALSRMFLQQSGKKIDFTDEQAETVCVFKIVSDDFTGKKKPKKS